MKLHEHHTSTRSLALQSKSGVDVGFKPLEAMLGPIGGTGEGCPTHAEVVATDFSKLEATPALHAAFGALHHLAAAASAAGAGHVIDSAQLVSTASAALPVPAAPAAAEAQTALLSLFARTCCSGGQLSPMAAVIGGIAAQVTTILYSKFIQLYCAPAQCRK
jgi:hypothetical protein